MSPIFKLSITIMDRDKGFKPLSILLRLDALKNDRTPYTVHKKWITSVSGF